MENSDSDTIDHDIKALFDAEEPPSSDEMAKQRKKNRARVQANVAQRDTIMFAFVKVWTVLADMLAPLFAAFATKKVGSVKQASKINKK